MIHAAIPDGEVDEIRKRHSRDAQGSRLRMDEWITELQVDRATLLARLTALEAENAALKAELHKAECARDAYHVLSDHYEETIAALKAEVAEARAKCAKVCDDIKAEWVNAATGFAGAPEGSKKMEQYDRCMARAKVADDIATIIRSLSTSQGEQER